jgi:hypothetical protein
VAANENQPSRLLAGCNQEKLISLRVLSVSNERSEWVVLCGFWPQPVSKRQGLFAQVAPGNTCKEIANEDSAAHMLRALRDISFENP